MQSIALVTWPATGQRHWPGLDQINAILAADGVKISVTEIEPYSEEIMKRGFAKVFCAQDEKLNEAYRAFFGEDGTTFNNCLLVGPSKLAHRVDVFTLRWVDLPHESERPESVPQSDLIAFYAPR